jgi:hypothetical protein
LWHWWLDWQLPLMSYWNWSFIFSNWWGLWITKMSSRLSMCSWLSTFTYRFTATTATATAAAAAATTTAAAAAATAAATTATAAAAATTAAAFNQLMLFNEYIMQWNQMIV